jgi:hypothetical protein
MIEQVSKLDTPDQLLRRIQTLTGLPAATEVRLMFNNEEVGCNRSQVAMAGVQAPSTFLAAHLLSQRSWDEGG